MARVFSDASLFARYVPPPQRTIFGSLLAIDSGAGSNASATFESRILTDLLHGASYREYPPMFWTCWWHLEERTGKSGGGMEERLKYSRLKYSVGQVLQ